LFSNFEFNEKKKQIMTKLFNSWFSRRVFLFLVPLFFVGKSVFSLVSLFSAFYAFFLILQTEKLGSYMKRSESPTDGEGNESPTKRRRSTPDNDAPVQTTEENATKLADSNLEEVDGQVTSSNDNILRTERPGELTSELYPLLQSTSSETHPPSIESHHELYSDGFVPRILHQLPARASTPGVNDPTLRRVAFVEESRSGVSSTFGLSPSLDSFPSAADPANSSHLGVPSPSSLQISLPRIEEPLGPVSQTGHISVVAPQALSTTAETALDILSGASILAGATMSGIGAAKTLQSAGVPASISIGVGSVIGLGAAVSYPPVRHFAEGAIENLESISARPFPHDPTRPPSPTLEFDGEPAPRLISSRLSNDPNAFATAGPSSGCQLVSSKDNDFMSFTNTFMDTEMIIQYGIFFCVYLIISILVNEYKKTILRWIDLLRKDSPALADFMEEYVNFPMLSHGPWARVFLCFLLLAVFTALR
jgi:hypothetical protein